MALIDSLSSGVSALQAFSKGLGVIGDNIANVNTTGFKSSRADYQDSFSDLLRDSAPATGNTSNTSAMQVGSGVNLASVRANFAQGSLSSTGVGTDLGLAGPGFFTLRDPANGNLFVTRAGDFRLDDVGNLVSNEGLRVQGLNDGSAQFTATVLNGALSYSLSGNTVPAAIGDLRVDAPLSLASGALVDGTGGLFTAAEIDAAAPRLSSFTVDNSGNLVVTMSNGQSFNRGQVLLQDFRDPSALVREGGNKYSGTASAGPVGGVALSAASNTPGLGGLGKIESGTLELSNVDLTAQFAEMITVQRSFQAGSRIITVSDQVLEEVVNLKR